VTVEANKFQGVQVDAFETACIDHVVLGVGARAVEGRDTAVAAKVMKRAVVTELIRRQGVLHFHKTESIRRYHVMEVSLAPADRAIAFAHARKVGSDFELDPTAMAGASIGFHFAASSHASLLLSYVALTRPSERSSRESGGATGYASL